jgi:hypothetical protein
MMAGILSSTVDCLILVAWSLSRGAVPADPLQRRRHESIDARSEYR